MSQTQKPGESSTLFTHKEWNNYADKYDHDYPLTAVPREPSEYRPYVDHDGEEHFLNQKRKRGIDGDVIRGCIEEGDVRYAEGDNRYRFLWQHPTTLQTFSLIVELRADAFRFEKEKHEAVTVYRFQHD